ncbi:MerR family transcriptional regulator [Streptomyces mangrovisoli]|uniref:MerR family transcriptional regulator n=1 Tax=Streptomyces mangrovisoli TaxID=1428628 RepID=UPI0009A0EACD|nr:MerR family transcriptional regulator [Streptomyces mangrovisoli]
MDALPDRRGTEERTPGGAEGEAGLTTGALARRLGVSPTTIRSWDRRYGIGPAVRPDGRHRRWTSGDVAVLEAMCRLTAAGVPPAEAARAARGQGVAEPGLVPEPAFSPGSGRSTGSGRSPGSDRSSAPDRSSGPERSSAPDRSLPGPGRGGRAAGSAAAGTLPLGDVRQECRGLARAAVRLDAPAVEDLLTTAVGEHGVVAAWHEVMMPTLHAVGRKWASSGDRYVEVEHLLSWHVSTALRRCTAPARAQDDSLTGGPVLLACLPGEQHTLPMEALNASLAELGLATRMFGAAVPAEALTAAVERLGPAAVVLWAQARSTANPGLARHVAETQWGVKGARRRPLVVLGGPGWAGRPTPAMPRPADLRSALTLLSELYGRTAR